MKPSILLLAVSVAALSSCTTSYKTGQTPDDVYYSPARPQQDNEEVFSERQDDRRYRNEYYDDRYLRMKVHNRTRWSDLDDWYNNDRYSLGFNYSYGSYNNPYNSWNYYYNPYCCCHNNNIYNNPKTTVAYSKPRMFNLNNYNSNTQTNGGYQNPKYSSSTNSNNTYNGPRYNDNSNRNSNSGNILRNIFNGISGSSGSSGSHNASSGSNNSNSSSGSSGSSTPAPVRKF